jgi:nitroreductase/NAD-dependent dihydropyrimidine dehydrogenase PreA subunit
MDLFEVNEKTCLQDGICAQVCPVKVIELEKGGYPRPVADADSLCIRCGHCVAVCPTESLRHRVIAPEKCPPIDPALAISAAAAEQFLRSRRSIRVYEDRSVARADLQRLIELARYAPSGHNSQGAKWLVLGKENLPSLAGVVVDWMRWVIAHNQEMAYFLHLERTVQRWEEGEDVILRNAPTVIIAHADVKDRLAPSTCTIALAYLELAATSLGLGTCWAGYFNMAAATFPPMKAALDLPEGHQALGSMMVGYPAFTYQRLPTRKTPEITWRL